MAQRYGEKPLNETILVHKVHNDIQLRHCLKIREEVFIQEQQVDRDIEIDEHDTLVDPVCTHFLLIVNGMPAGTARAITLEDKVIKIQRVAISKSYRGGGFGAVLLKAIEDNFDASKFILGAQEHAIPFYERQGYVICSDTYIEADIKHKNMEKTIG